MTDPISLSAGLLALTAFAYQSCMSLYKALESFQTHQKRIRELKEELKTLTDVLQSLQTTVASNEFSLEELKTPLLHCGQACRGLETVIIECTLHSGRPRTSFRDWARLRYKGSDIAEFKDVMKTHQSVISIVLLNANLRTSTVTTSIVQACRETIANTASDLEDRLQGIEDRLQSLPVPTTRAADVEAEIQQQTEERMVAQQGLLICRQVSEDLSQLRVNVFEDISAAPDARQAIVSTFGDLISARRVTAGAGATQILGHMSDSAFEHLIGARMGNGSQRIAVEADEVASASDHVGL